MDPRLIERPTLIFWGRGNPFFFNDSGMDPKLIEGPTLISWGRGNQRVAPPPTPPHPTPILQNKLCQMVDLIYEYYRVYEEMFYYLTNLFSLLISLEDFTSDMDYSLFQHLKLKRLIKSNRRYKVYIANVRWIAYSSLCFVNARSTRQRKK